jgi:hypothetical protein
MEETEYQAVLHVNVVYLSHSGRGNWQNTQFLKIAKKQNPSVKQPMRSVDRADAKTVKAKARREKCCCEVVDG